MLGFTLLVVGADPGRDPNRGFDDQPSDTDEVDEIFDGLNQPEFQDNGPIQSANNLEDLWSLDPDIELLENPNNNQPIEYQGQGLGYRWENSEADEPPPIGAEVTVVEGRSLGVRGTFQSLLGNRAFILDPHGQVHDVLVSLIRAVGQDNQRVPGDLPLDIQFEDNVLPNEGSETIPSLESDQEPGSVIEMAVATFSTAPHLLGEGCERSAPTQLGHGANDNQNSDLEPVDTSEEIMAVSQNEVQMDDILGKSKYL